MASGKGIGKKQRSYKPAVEALEALRLLSSATLTLPDLVVERDFLAGSGPIESDTAQLSDQTWDAALVETRLADILGRSQEGTDAEGMSSGLAQLNRYLSRAWFRAGIPTQLHDDCSQAVYLLLMVNLGRHCFDRLVVRIGRRGIRDVLSRETDEGPDFFRAVDTVKKRAQRERTFQPLDTLDVVAAPGEDEVQKRRRGALQEVIDQSLSPREAALIQATLKGETPAEIASQWGIAPKTVSNEKTRVIQKLRELLVADLCD